MLCAVPDKGSEYSALVWPTGFEQHVSVHTRVWEQQHKKVGKWACDLQSVCSGTSIRMCKLWGEPVHEMQIQLHHRVIQGM
jgi:hypothetical protein